MKAAHDIYVWERAMGSLIKILEGPKEELTDIDVLPWNDPLSFSGTLRNRLSSRGVWIVGPYISGVQQSLKVGALLLQIL